MCVRGSDDPLSSKAHAARWLTAPLRRGAAPVLFLLAGAVAAQDVLYRQTTTLILGPARTGGYALSEQTEVEVEYASERSTRERSFYVGDAFYAPVEDLEGRWNGRRLGCDNVQTFVPPRRTCS